MMDLGSICGWAATILFGGCYIPQIIRTYKLKTVGDVSVWQWLIQLVGYASGLYFALSLHNAILIFGYSWGLACTLLFLFLYWLYQKNR